MAVAALVVRELGKSFGGRAVLDRVDLEIGTGSLVAILGASGSGKTTLLRLIAGFERADRGEIAIDGRAVSGRGAEIPAQRRRIGYVAQEGALFPHLRVADNIAFGLPAASRRARQGVGELLDLVGLPPGHASRWPHELSGGEQQRVALARALAPKPRLVLLDEPFSSLDAALRAGTRDAVAAALAAAGATTILVTHDQSEALSMGQRVAVLREGRLVQVAEPETLYRQPVDAALARFVGDAVVLPGRASGGTLRCRLGRLRASLPVADGPVEIMIRPEQIALAPPSSLQAVAVVRGVTFHGPDATVALVMADGTRVSARVAGHVLPAVGTTVELRVEGAVIAFAGPAAPRPRGPAC